MATSKSPSLRSRLRTLVLGIGMRLPVSARRPLRRLYVLLLRWRARHSELETAYARLLSGDGAGRLGTLARNAPGPRVLMATTIGSYQHGVALDTILGVALTLRGAQVDFLQCDAVLPACLAMDTGTVEPRELANGKRPYLCTACTAQGASLYRKIGLPRIAMSELVDEAARTAIADRVKGLDDGQLSALNDGGIALGEHALAGALRFFARGDLRGEPTAPGVLRRYAEGALTTAVALEKALSQSSYDVVVAHHGIYVPQGIIGEVCRRRGVRLVTWNPAYRRHCFIFSHEDTYHHTMVTEPASNWENLPWSDELETAILRYLESRWHGTEDWISFHSDSQHDARAIAAETGIDFTRPVITLLSNVIWDAQLHYPSNAFPSMLDWIFETIRYFSGRPDLQLAIRIHPAEVTGFLPSRQFLAEEIARAFPRLPSNIFVIAPTSPVSTYTLCEQSNAVLIYNTKTGIEIAAKGIPVIVAGEAWIRNKGFCRNPTSAAEYLSLLDSLPFLHRLTEAERRRALIYAYHVFFRRMIPLPFLTAHERFRFTLELDSMDELARGRFPGLDVICDGILRGSEFIYPAEAMHQPAMPAGASSGDAMLAAEYQ